MPSACRYSGGRGEAQPRIRRNDRALPSPTINRGPLRGPRRSREPFLYGKIGARGRATPARFASAAGCHQNDLSLSASGCGGGKQYNLSVHARLMGPNLAQSGPGADRTCCLMRV